MYTFRVSDITNCHLSLGDGVIDFPLFFKTLKENNYTGFITLEINPSEKKVLEKNIHFIKSNLQ